MKWWIALIRALLKSTRLQSSPRSHCSRSASIASTGNNFSGFSEFASELKHHVDDDNPPIISVQVPGTQFEHMWVIVAYDDTYWTIYNPDPSYMTCYRVAEQSQYSLRENGSRKATDVLVLSPRDRIT